MRVTTVILDEKEYTIKELRHRQNKEWREKLEGYIEELAAAVEAGVESDITELTSIVQLVRAVVKYVIQSTDLMCELVILYAPNLSEAVEGSYDSEIADAFVEVLKLAYPFSKVIGTLRQLTSELPQTQRSSPLRNGGSGTTK